MTIFKYPIPIEDNFQLELPTVAKILTVQLQRGEPCIWASVGREMASTTVRKFRLVGTGHDYDPTDLDYVGTFQMLGGALVYHLFVNSKI